MDKKVLKTFIKHINKKKKKKKKKKIDYNKCEKYGKIKEPTFSYIWDKTNVEINIYRNKLLKKDI